MLRFGTGRFSSYSGCKIAALLILYLLHSGLVSAQDSNARFISGVGQVMSLGSIEYVEVNTSTFDREPKQLIIFVHGTPGSLTAFLRYFNDPGMRENFHMISVTRPGWVSNDDDKIPSLAAQACHPRW